LSQIGQTVSNYRILEEIGRGGMGVVYKARDERLGRLAAVKFLPRRLTEDPEARQRFLVEAQAASQLEDANVCPVYEAGETEEGQLYIAMAFYEGGTLGQRIARGPLGLDAALRIAVRVCRGLARAHDEGIVHRDIKPANIMLTDRGEIKIVDFGLARLGEGARLTRAGSTLGTPAYMSPEQIRGGAVDARSDVWAVGVLLYEMVTGELPFSGGPDSAMVHAILHEEPKPLPEGRPDLSAELQSVLSRALTKEVGQRYQTIAELLSDLVSLSESGELRTLAQETPGPRPGIPLRSGSARKRVIAAAVFAAIVTLGLFLFRDRGEPPDEPVAEGAGRSDSTLAVLPFTVRGGPDYQYLGEGMVDLLGTSLDGAGDLRTVDTHALLGFLGRQSGELTDRPLAELVAENFAAELFVIGEILEIAGRLRLSASLYRAGGVEPISRAVEEGDAEEIFEAVDHLAAALVAEMVSGPGAELSRIAAVTTDSLPALKLHLAGEALFRAGRFPQALEAFQAAVEEDPRFALAWYRLSVAAEWASRTDLLDAAAARATELSDRLSEHNRQLLEARLESRRGRVDDAEHLYRTILERYPDDVEAWIQLAELEIHYGPLEGGTGAESRQSWERVLELEPDNASALWHLVRIVSYAGDLEALESTVQKLLVLNPDSDRMLEILAIRAYARGDLEAQREVLEGLSSSPSDVVASAAWNVAIATHELGGVAAILELLTDPSRPLDVRAVGHTAAAYAEIAQGRLTRARAHLGAAAELAPSVALAHEALTALLPFLPMDETRLGELQRNLISWDTSSPLSASNPTYLFSAHTGLHEGLRQYLLGSVEARLGKSPARDRARGIEELSLPERFEVFRAAAASSVRAQVLLKAEEPGAALAALGEKHPQTPYQDVNASPFLSLSYERYLRAETLASLGRLEEAVRWFSSFEEVSYYDIAFVAPSHYRRAQISERLGRPAKAAEHYRRFLRLWADADAELRPWRERAQTRLSALG
jgi:tetratricopeptide (TPR) repeat protein